MGYLVEVPKENTVQVLNEMVRTAGETQAVSMLMNGRPLMTDQSRHFQQEPSMQKQTAMIQIHLQNNQLQNKTNYKTKTITNKTITKTQTITRHYQLQTVHTQTNPSMNQTRPDQSLSQSINQSIDQSFNQPINQSINSTLSSTSTQTQFHQT